MTAHATLIDRQLAQLPGALALQWPGGCAGPVAGGAPTVVLKLRHRRLLLPLAQGRIGDLADAYVQGDLDLEGEMPDVMAVAGALVHRTQGHPTRPRAVAGARWPLKTVRHWRSRWLHRLQRDAQHVRFHYDVGDDFFALWLDPLRVYSCAYFAQDGMSLQQAQAAKLDLVCRKLQLAAGHRLLDVGAGWGALLIHAASHHGVRAVGITLSRHQHEHVGHLIAAAGLRGQVQVHLMDYREVSPSHPSPVGGEFDRIASVGMFEHVGQAQMAAYFNRMHSLLRPGGLLLNHAIAAGGLDNAQLGAGMGDFIEKHIFPGGELMHVSRAIEGLSHSGLELLDAENLRPHYARTLWLWSAALEANLARARTLASEATVRAYRLYLAGSAMCFERGWLSLYQLLAARPNGGSDGLGDSPNEGRSQRGLSWAAQSDYPFRRHHMWS
jgi:cyclopropane-fatty-acyl-phospholipid synthase